MKASRFVLGLMVSCGFHGLAFAHVNDAKAKLRLQASPTVIEIDEPPPRPAKPEPEPEPTPEPSAAPAAPAAAVAPAHAPVAPPHALAQAGKVLTAEADAPGVADFTMVEGAGTYAGGITSSTGTSKTSVSTASAPVSAAAGGRGSGGSGTAPSGPDQSKPARPIGRDWDCKSLFPAEAKDAAATVIIIARVRPDGSPESIAIVTEPGQGFGAAARACAMRQRYAPAEDREGRTIAASTSPFRVRFTR